MTYNLHDQIQALTRQISLAERAFPLAIKSGKMTAVQCNKEIGALKAALRTLVDLCDGIEPLPPTPRFDQFGVRC
jgi:hypothetical protein